MTGKCRWALYSMLLLLAGSSTAAEPGWGHLKARFVYDGKPPKRALVDVNKDIEVCGKEELFDESLVVNAKNGGLANVIVWMVVEKGQELPDEHPDHLAAAKKEVVLDAEKCRYEPHVSLVRTKQTLRIENRDLVGHNPKVQTLNNARIGAIIPAGPTSREVFKNVEPLPSIIDCSIHPWMSARLLIQDHPYMAVSNADGHLTMRNVPVGKWTFRAWHERVGWLKDVSIGERNAIWKKGQFNVEIKSGEHGLGTVKLSPDIFKR